MSNLFHEDMTYTEAQLAFFTAVKGRNPSEIEDIKEEYLSVLPTITEKELLNNAGRMSGF